MEDDADGDEGLPPSPEVVAISEFLFVLLDPLAEKLSELPDPDLADTPLRHRPGRRRANLYTPPMPASRPCP